MALNNPAMRNAPGEEGHTSLRSHGLPPLALYNSTGRNPPWKSERGLPVRVREGFVSMPKVTLVNEKKEIEVDAGANLRDELRKAGVQVNFYPIDTSSGLIGRYLNCMGHATCGTCKVLVKKGMENLSAKGKLEKFTLFRMLTSIGYEDEVRLSCQVKVNGDCTIETRPGMNWSGDKFWQKPYPNK
jgi:ferredoxin